ncbi:hypothetical protein MMUC44124_02390 [Mycolicibacterium mucogenicum DSM 44124]|nr:hypothetical protein MMUC44124_02390 [Mycolicibacterium mucogenicum DSM 44124]
MNERIATGPLEKHNIVEVHNEPVIADVTGRGSDIKDPASDVALIDL